MDLKTSLGLIRGVVTAAPNGKQVAKFLGIPYAQQPVGKLRFKPLQPLKLPLGTEKKPFEAMKEGNSSIQNTSIRSATVLPTGEDCIYLNIYTPADKIDTPKPVFFHIHGGSFYFSSGSEPICDLANFASRHNVVGVSINYRLGLLGFLSLPPLIDENLGLNDQQFALKWVQEHIKSFGGDPSRVILYGFSAGSVSAHLHMLNEESSPLFHKVILCSAVARDMNCIPPEKQKTRVKWALTQLKCPETTKSDDKIHEFLMNLDASKFASVPAIARSILLQGPIPVNTFIKNQGSFLPLTRKPILTGVIAEGNLFAYNKKVEKANTRRPRKLLSEMLTYDLFIKPLNDFRLELSKNNKKFKISHGQATDSPYPIFCYYFDYDTRTRNDKILPETLYKVTFGKFHGLDIMFFLNHCCEGSVTVPEASPMDKNVNTAVAEMIDMFLTQNIEDPLLPICSAKNPIISRITGKGRVEEKFSFKPRTEGLKTKAFFALVATKMMPKRY